MTIQQLKQRFGIIGSSPLLDRAIDIAQQVAPTDLSVLISGESGTGKEVMPQIIHQLGARKHGQYIAVNCGAIPEGTIDSELFGHEKGSFTGVHEARKGYFEVADGGTIFLDEVAELPLPTQARLLRVLETGEFIRVGSSKVQKTNVRIVAATNVNVPEAIKKGKFREDLYYRLNTVPIHIPSLRDRKEDIHLLFRKFASDFADKYKMPTIRLDKQAQEALIKYSFPGNVRQLKNVTEQISIIENEREISDEILLKYLPQDNTSKLPVLFKGEEQSSEFSEREILYKVLFDMKNDITDLKKIVFGMIQGNGVNERKEDAENLPQKFHRDITSLRRKDDEVKIHDQQLEEENAEEKTHEIVEETLSLQQTEIGLIKKALAKYKDKRKKAAEDLGISERTLYRKIKEYNL